MKDLLPSEKRIFGKQRRMGFVFGVISIFPTACPAVLSVFDSSTYGLTSQLLSSFQESFNEMKIMSSDIESMRNILGKGDIFDFSDMESMLKKERTSLIPFATIGEFSSDDSKSLDFLSYRKMFEKSWLGSFNEKGQMTRRHQDHIVKFREARFKDSILTGMAFVAHQKTTLKQSSMDLSSILKEADHATNLRSDATTTNRLLSFIAHETIQTRALLIQILEVQNMKEGFNLPIALERSSSQGGEF